MGLGRLVVDDQSPFCLGGFYGTPVDFFLIFFDIIIL